VPTPYRLHDLRHTAGSHLLAEGVPLPEVSQILGHANPAITARLYAHAVRRERGAAFRQLGAYYRRAADDGDEGAAGRPAPTDGDGTDPEAPTPPGPPVPDPSPDRRGDDS
jgi:hypothetical protein